MRGMDSKEALRFIASRCGLSEDMVRRVQKAESEYVLQELAAGHNATLPGRGTFTPDIRSKLLVGGSLSKYVCANFKISSSIKNELAKLHEYKNRDIATDSLDDAEGVLLTQIPGLQ